MFATRDDFWIETDAGVGEVGKAGRAVLMLLINVTMLLVGGYPMLLAQRGLRAVESRRGISE